MNVQDAFHHDRFDYVPGSPHLKHDDLRAAIRSSLRALVEASIERTGGCKVLELGAGHGTFTDALVDAGADVVVTEMSSPSAQVLSSRFRGNDAVRVEFDPDGGWAFRTGCEFDVVVCISVLHHIPDYLAAVARLAEITAGGGAFVCWQDPMLYAGMPRHVRAASTASYFAWRTRRGHVRRGLATRLRRIRGRYDENKPQDSAEYHVVRDGVDQGALVSVLERDFAAVHLRTYWSTQARSLHRVGERLGLANTFAIEATGRRVGPSEVLV